jgi:DNA-binding MarR family transcriptional regulator
MLFEDVPPGPLAHYPGFLLVFAGMRQARRMRETLHPLGVHPRHFGVLTLVANRPGCTQQQLSDMTGIDRSSMVAVLDELEQRGLAERRPDPDDRRKRSIHVTAKGERMREQCEAAGLRLQDELLEVLTSAERAEFVRLLRKVAGVDLHAPSPEG